MDEWIAIYKGLRLPLLGLVFLFISAYIFWPSRKSKMEQAKFNMLTDGDEDNRPQ